jgi:predicted nucleotidyltransferase
MLHSTLSRRGGKARSARKTKANRAKAAAYWKAVREGQAAPPRRHRRPPSLEEIRRRLAPFCRRAGIVRLDIFGSVARGDAQPGSDVDFIADFAANPSLNFFAMEGDIGSLLGVPAHLLTRESVLEMTNRIRREAILASACTIYHAPAKT